MVAFTIWNFPIHRYGIFYFISFVVGYFFLRYIGKSKVFGDKPQLQYLLEERSEDIVLAVLLWVMIGGRIWHIIIYWGGYYMTHIGDIFALWKWWMSFIGGMIGVLISFLILRKIKKLTREELWLLFDCILTFVPFGIFLGRIGNFLNQELYGISVPSGFWSMWYVRFSLLNELNIFHVYKAIDDTLRINTNLISMLTEWLLLLSVTGAVMYTRIKKKIYHAGQITWIFLLWYSSIRFFLEYIREDSQGEFLGTFTKSQWFFIWFFLLGIIILFRKKILRSKSYIK